MVRTRFAPSPTGYLHIGGVRTALYNWLFARQHGGQFILRIDDTDQGRNQPEALQPILDGFRWLGLDWDEGADVGGPHGPYYQSERLGRYREALDQLLASGHAYRDFATAEEMKAERDAADAKKEPFVYSRRWMATTPAECAAFEAQGRTGVVRLKMPREGACAFFDHVRQDMNVPWSAEQDHVIAKADGSVLYNLASVVDDFDMKITHVIRAVEHLSNTPRQIFMLEALGYPRPEYAHLPFVCEPGSKNKLSKRKLDKYLESKGPAFKDFVRVYNHGLPVGRALGADLSPGTFSPIVVDFFRTVGYLPDAILNYMLLVGWSLDGSTEDFSRQDMIRHFSLGRVNSDPGSFDAGKLWAFQERYANALTPAQKVDWTLPYLQKTGLVADPAPPEVRQALERVLTQVAHRLVTAGDVLEYAYFFLPDAAVARDEAAFDKFLRKKAGAKEWLAGLRAELAALPAFDAPTLEGAVKGFAERGGLKLGDLAQAARVATTGKGAGFGTFETLALLGRERTLARLDLTLASL